jgi:thiamine kinase-like enzyme
VTSAIHGDVWCDNVMIGPGKIWLIDWDDLRIGDPVVDAAILLYGSYGSDLGAWAGAWPPQDQDEATRFEVALRAQALDAVIDVLADWVEAAKAPDHVDGVRADKEAAHRSALAQYRDLYPQ